MFEATMHRYSSGTGSESSPASLRPVAPHPGLPSADDGLRPVGHLELEQDVRDVVAHRLQAHEQLPRYLLVAFTLPDETEDLLFSLGEFWEGALGRAPVLGALAAAFGIWYALGALGVVAYPF